MATKTPQPAPSLPDELVWLAAALVAQLGVLIAHDGGRLPSTGAAHFAAETADNLLVEFQRRYRSGGPR